MQTQRLVLTRSYKRYKCTFYSTCGQFKMHTYLLKKILNVSMEQTQFVT